MLTSVPNAAHTNIQWLHSFTQISAALFMLPMDNEFIIDARNTRAKKSHKKTRAKLHAPYFISAP